MTENFDDIFRILVCTDTHAGYKERDRIRCNDSLNTLEEIFIIANNENVDLVLHSGDLFDVAKPSKSTLYKVMNLFRKYCLGNKKINFEYMNERSALQYSEPNWQSGDVRVSIPVFAIHGNHDDPGEEAMLSPLDILESARFLNYIGKSNNLEDIKVFPTLIKKGRTKIAIYGLGNIRDERLYRSFERDKVKFMIPDNLEKDGWFSILLFHQNRKKGNFGGTLSKDYIPEYFLPNCLDLVIWGHEHECICNPVEVDNKSFYLIQPGSSITTSLIQAESIPKHVVLLEVCGNTFKTMNIPLLTPRTFLYKTITLLPNVCDVEGFLRNKIESLILETEKVTEEKWGTKASHKSKISHLFSGNSMNKLPLIRLRVEYSNDDHLINIQRFGYQYIGKIANPHETLTFYKQTRFKSTLKNEVEDDIPLLLSSRVDISTSGDEYRQIGNLTLLYLQRRSGLEILNERDLNDAVSSFVHKQDNTAIESFIDKFITNIYKFGYEKLRNSSPEKAVKFWKLSQNYKKENKERCKDFLSQSDTDESLETNEIQDELENALGTENYNFKKQRRYPSYDAERKSRRTEIQTSRKILDEPW
ncbi:putative serine/threonine protein phosphatase [Cryptosporidium serpentis]